MRRALPSLHHDQVVALHVSHPRVNHLRVMNHVQVAITLQRVNQATNRRNLQPRRTMFAVSRRKRIAVPLQVKRIEPPPLVQVAVVTRHRVVQVVGLLRRLQPWVL